jgi:pyruvate/2-oxoglutarate dehydrogenase complex dihydrolipoamide acyltransferase (E2) component
MFENLAGTSGERAMYFLDDLIADRDQTTNQSPMFSLVHEYGLPPAMIRDLQSRFAIPDMTVANLSRLRDSARTGAPLTIFEDLPPESREGAVRMITNEIERRMAEAPAQPAALPAPTQPGPLALRDPVPRAVLTMSVPDLIADMSPALNRQAQEIADTYFNDNVIDGNNVTISALTNMVRNYRAGPHADSPNVVRELAARRLEQMNTESMMNAETIADTLNEVFYDDMEGPAEARERIQSDIRMLEQHGEGAWEDLVGPMAEDIPWSRTTQHHLIQYLRALLENRPDFAKGGLVKKKRKAKKPTMALVVTRKNPGLAEMAYRYGGMVR